MDGKAYLEKVISDRLRAARELPEGNRMAGVMLHEIQGIATGLVFGGALSQSDADKLLIELRRTMQRYGWVTVVTQHASTTSDFGPEAFAQRAATPPRAPQSPKASVVPELHRVVPLVGRKMEQGSVTRTFISLEVWNDVLIVRSATPRDDDWHTSGRRQFTDVHWRWRAWDDAGTQYRSISSSGSSSSGLGALVFENRAFYPSPPQEADLLTVIAEHPDQQATVELPLH
jgi:hypothetical protein